MPPHILFCHIVNIFCNVLGLCKASNIYYPAAKLKLADKPKKVGGHCARCCSMQWSVDKKTRGLPSDLSQLKPVNVQQVSSKSGLLATVCCPRHRNLWLSLSTRPLTSVKQAKQKHAIWHPYALLLWIDEMMKFSGQEKDKIWIWEQCANKVSGNCGK